MTPDVGVLFATSLADHVHQKIASTWRNSAIDVCEDGGTIEILPMVAAGLLRLLTNSKVFLNASSTSG